MGFIKIGICGAPSAGKTTSAERIRALLKRKYDVPSVEAVREYARHYIEETGQVENIFEQWSILEGQKKWERQAERTYEFIISDSPMFLPYVYTVMLADCSKLKHRYMVTSMYERALAAISEYDVIYLLPVPRKVQRDGLRSQGDGDAQPLHDAIEHFLISHVDDFRRVPEDLECSEGAMLEDVRAEWIVEDLKRMELVR